jgi:integrase
MALADPQRESLGRRYTAEGRGRYRQRESAADEPFRYRPAWRRHSHLQAKFVKTDGRLERGMHDAVNLNDVFDRGDGPPIDPDALSKAFRLARGKLGLDRVRLHDVRHLFASMLVANGTNVRVVSEPLGHSTASFTLSVYVHPDEAAAVTAINDAERMLGG